MDYTRFVRLRSAVWDDFATRLDAARAGRPALQHEDLEALAFRYRQILHDHAVAGARYPATGVARRLERLALEGTHWLHRERPDPALTLGGFFGRAFPEAFRRQAPATALALALFAATAAFGFSLATLQPAMALSLLGPEAVAGLEQGHLWTESLVTTVPPAVASSGIATNNMAVALAGWAGGALAGLGSLYVILINGLLLGAIVGVTARYSLATALLSFVSAHGPLEITLILVTAAAGLGLGRALVAPDDRPRREAVAAAGRDGLIVLIGCLPWFAVLGVVEAVISPAPSVAAILKLALGLALEGAFLVLAWNPSSPAASA